MISKNQINYIKDLSRKVNRVTEKKFIVEGEKLVNELLLSGTEYLEIFAIQSWIDNNPGVKCTVVTDKELSRISQLKSPNKVLAIVLTFDDDLSNETFEGLTIFLDGINDPGNLGTILRMADWFGINQIVCTNQSVDVYNSKVIQSSMGSVFRIPVYYVDGVEFLSYYSKQNKDNPIIGATMEGTSLQEVVFPENGLLIMGSESHGIESDIENFVTKFVTIPKIGQAESLNVAVATSIILWEWKRRKLLK